MKSNRNSFVLFGAVLLGLGYGTSAQAGSISGTVTQQEFSGANLTALGNTDWAVWGQGSSTSLAPTTRKAGGSAISNLTDITNGDPLRGLGQFGYYGESSVSWTDGTPTASASNVYAGIQNNATSPHEVGEGFSFTVAAGTNPEELTIFDAVNYSTITLTATLSDSSASPFSQTFTNTGYNKAFYSVLDFSADSAGQTLTVRMTATTNYAVDGSGNIDIQAVALSTQSAGTPEPGTVGLCLAGMVAFGLKSIRRR